MLNLINDQTSDLEGALSALQDDIKQNTININKILIEVYRRPLTAIEKSDMEKESSQLENLVTEKHKEIMNKLNKMDDKIDLLIKMTEDGFRLTESQNHTRSKILEELKLSPQGIKIYSSKQLGQGAMGTVCKGFIIIHINILLTTIELNKIILIIMKGLMNGSNLVAVKVLNNVDPSLIAGLENEILMLKLIGNHPSILHCYGFYKTKETFNIVMDIATYGALTNIIYDKVKYPDIPIYVTLMWINNLIDALVHIHSKNVKHRDVKSGNLLVYNEFKIKLSDFGFSKDSNASSKTSIVGTGGFIAPEILYGQGSYCASDIFSFAMTVVEIITRSAPNVNKHYNDRITTACDGFLARDDFKKEDIHSFKELLLECVKYDRTKEQFDPSIRPTAKEVKRRLFNILVHNYGDDELEMIDRIQEFEKQFIASTSSKSPAGKGVVFSDDTSAVVSGLTTTDSIPSIDSTPTGLNAKMVSFISLLVSYFYV